MVQEIGSNYANRDTYSSYEEKRRLMPAWEPERRGGAGQPKLLDEYVEKLALYKKRIRELERRIPSSKPKPLDDEELWRQSEAYRHKLESIFNIDPDDDIDIDELDGLLSDFVDENQNSMELVRAIRGG